MNAGGLTRGVYSLATRIKAVSQPCYVVYMCCGDFVSVKAPVRAVTVPVRFRFVSAMLPFVVVVGVCFAAKRHSA